MFDGIPDELLQLQQDELAQFIKSREQLREGLDIGKGWRPFTGSEHVALKIVYSSLGKCPDQAPAPGTTELLFIPDAALRDSIRRDISAANQDMVNGEWKGATVLAGSATEALLLWAVQNLEGGSPGMIPTTIAALVTAGTLQRKPELDPERWGLTELIEVSLHLGLVSSETAQQARLGKDFRNLIHPGRAQRLGKVCDRGTALSALAAVEQVVRDLSARP